MKKVKILVLVLVLSLISFSLVIFLTFPLFSNGLSLNRSIGSISITPDGLRISISAYVYRGIWFSPDGPKMHRRYYETLLLLGEGKKTKKDGITGNIYLNGENLKCIGTKYYDAGSVFISNDKSILIVNISKNWRGNLEQAYVNGKYTKEILEME